MQKTRPLLVALAIFSALELANSGTMTIRTAD